MIVRDISLLCTFIDYQRVISICHFVAYHWISMTQTVCLRIVYAGIRKWAELLTIHWQVCCLPLLSHCPLLLHSQEHLQRHTIRCLCLWWLCTVLLLAKFLQTILFVGGVLFLGYLPRTTFIRLKSLSSIRLIISAKIQYRCEIFE